MRNLSAEDIVFFLFIAGLFDQFVKVGDFLVTPTQQVKIQKLMERVNDRLTNVRPFQVIRFLKTGVGTAILGIPLVSIILFMIVSVVRGLYTEQLLTWEWSFSSIKDALTEFFISILGLVILLSQSYKVWRSSLESMLREERFGPFLWIFGKGLGIFAITAVPFAMLVTIILKWYPDETPTVLIVAMATALVLFGFVGLPRLAPTLSGVLALVIWGLAQFALVSIILVRALTYRIVVYQKGAWQAFVLILTIILGLVTTYLKYLKG